MKRLALTRRYLEIEEMRLGRRLTIDWQVPSSLPTIQLPTLSIQPLVENAIRHGIEPRVDGGRLSVKVVLEEKWVSVEIVNPLPPSQENVHRGHHLGLQAVQARLETQDANRGRLTTQRTDETFISTLELPIIASH